MHAASRIRSLIRRSISPALCPSILALLSALACFAGCSALNREGPNVSCNELQAGAINACKDGIIASCKSGTTVAYEVCTGSDGEKACEATWQKKTAYTCAQGTSSSGSSGSSGSSSSSGSSGSSGSPTGDASSGPTIETVFTGVGTPNDPTTAMPLTAIALDGTHIYVVAKQSQSTYNTFLFRIPIAGGNATTLLDYQNTFGFQVSGGLSGVGLDSTFAYSAGDNEVHRVPKSGGAATAFHSTSNGQLSTAATNGSVVCWHIAPSGIECKSSNAAAGPTTRLIQDGSPNSQLMQLDAVRLYFWQDGGALVSVPLAGGASAPIGTTGVPDANHGVAVDNQYVYWNDATANEPRKCSIQRAPKAGGAGSTPIASWDCPNGARQPLAVAVDAAHVWFATRDGLVQRVAKP